jgi:hypothetical protein
MYVPQRTSLLSFNLLMLSPILRLLLGITTSPILALQMKKDGLCALRLSMNMMSKRVTQQPRMDQAVSALGFSLANNSTFERHFRLSPLKNPETFSITST